MSQPNYSIESFYSFIEYVIEKGMIKKATALNWRNAASRLTSILGHEETNDLRELDVDELCTRYMNINSKDLTPSSLKVYRSRFKSALSDFISYTDSPIDYSPGITQRSTRRKKDESKTKQTNTPDVINKEREEVSSSQGGLLKSNRFPIPIRADLTVELYNVPFDLTEIEAEKISMVIKALAIR